MFNSPFAAKSKTDIARDKKTKEEIDSKIKYLSDLGRKCLNNPDFIKYRDECIDQKDKIIKLMIVNVNPDPIKDAYFLRACLNKLSALFEILELPKDDAGRKVENGRT